MSTDMISYRVATMEDLEGVMEVVKETLVVDEPMYEAAGLQPRDEENANLYKNASVISCLKSNVSFVAIDKCSDKIVGCCLNQIKLANDNTVISTPCPQPLHRMLEATDKEVDVYKQYQIESVLKMELLGVLGEYRKKGIGSTLSKMSIDKAAAEGCQGACAHVTSPYSQRIGEKNGFDVLKEVVFSGYEEDGKVLFEDTGVTKSFKLVGKKI